MARAQTRPPGARPACLRHVLALWLMLAQGCALASTEPRPQEAQDVMIRYQVELPERQAHRVHVRMTIEGVEGDAVQISMPVWTPGSYLVREFARHVLELGAEDAQGRALESRKLDKNTWRIAAPGGGPVHVDYVLYANERSVRTSHVDDRHAFLSPAGTFFSVDGRLREPHAVSVATPANWSVYTALEQDAGAWVAPDFDTLVDSPLEVGPHREFEFTVRGVPHRLVLAGEGELDTDRLVEDTTAICEEVAGIFDQMPFDRYLFLVPLVDAGGGGLEHKDSSVCMMNRWGFTDPKRYHGYLSLIAHEYFHAWNVKRFRPAALGPFDYDREVYTPDLWVAEGITSYFDDLATLRAGFAEKVGDYLEARAAAFRKEAERPASRRMSLAQSSHDAWIKLYRADENASNSLISYYSKGALVAFMLDLRLRRLSEGRVTLADVLRVGWERYTAQGQGFPEGALAELASEVSGHDLGSFFEDHVHGTVPLDPDPDLAWVGLRLAVTPQETKRALSRDDEGFPLEPDLGLTTSTQDGLVRVEAVLEGGAAYDAGLNHDDLILALDDLRVTPDSLLDRLDRIGLTETIVTFYRGQDLRRLSLTPQGKRLADWALVPVDEPTREQLEAFRSWCAWDHPASEAASEGSASRAEVVEQDA